jgi:hypothetical protein
MSVSKKDQQIEVLKAVAHPIRRGIISSLTYGQRAFSNLMLDCGLDPNSETGLFLYHLSKLVEGGFVEKGDGKYGLTQRGESTSRLLRSLPQPYVNSQIEKGGEKMTRNESAVQNITVERVACGDMVIDGWKFEPGEERLYEESKRLASDAFSGTFYVKECLGKVDLPGEPGMAYMVRHETYTRNYVGTEKNRVRTPLKEGHYLSMREYDTFSVRESGAYTLWTSVWGPNYETEGPEDMLYDPPEKWQEPPMRIGDEVSYEKKEGDYLLKVHSKVMGQYVVRVDDKSFDCLLKRTHSVWMRNGQKEIDRVYERYVTDGLLDTLTRIYHAPTQKRRWMFESVKGWEKNQTVECCGEKLYLTNEFFLAKRNF